MMLAKEDYEDAELVSLLADGELPTQDVSRALAHLAISADALQTWDCYHLVGEVLRSGAASARASDPAFVHKLRRKLTQETIEFVAVSALPIRAVGNYDIKIRSANDAWWRRVAGFASVVLVSVLAWQGYVLLDRHAPGQVPQLAQSVGQGVGGMPLASVVADGRGKAPGHALADAQDGSAAQALQLASATRTATGVESPPVMLRDARLEALLAAHRQFGGASALPMPSGF